MSTPVVDEAFLQTWSDRIFGIPPVGTPIDVLKALSDPATPDARAILLALLAKQETGGKWSSITEPCVAIVAAPATANLRSLPRVEASTLIKNLPHGTTVSVIRMTPSIDGFRWAYVVAGSDRGYIREDLLGGCPPMGLNAAIETPDASKLRWSSPVLGTQSFYQPFKGRAHKGVDIASQIGNSVVASAKGQVDQIFHCSQCYPGHQNFLEAGLELWDAAAIRDPKWGYGFGNYVVVRYPVQAVCPAGQKFMTADGSSWLFVLYAHVDKIAVAKDQSVEVGQQIATVGNTGNTSGPHLHVETRLSVFPFNEDVSQLRYVDPEIFFALR